jgi:hypothetical protein
MKMTNTVSAIISDEYLDECIQVESGGNPNSKARTSSATGLMQALDATWLGIVRKHAPSVMQGKTQKQVLNMRYDPSFSIEMLARFTEDNQSIVGRGATHGDLYLAHFLGAGSALRIYRADPNALVIQTLGNSGPAVARANPTIVKAKTTCAQLRAWAAKRMKESGGHGWVKKYYRPDSSSGVGIVSAQPLALEPERDDLPADFKGDVKLYDMQIALRTMGYDSGLMDGEWGGKTSGAISGFINDRHGFMPAPTSIGQFQASRDTLQAEVAIAEAENFRRPVTIARQEKDAATVAAVAPEIKPTKQNFFSTLLASIGSFLFLLWQTLSGYIGTLWNFFTSNKDNIPSSVTDPNTLMVWFHKIPPGVWLFALTVFFGFLAYNTLKAKRKIEDDVASGAR